MGRLLDLMFSSAPAFFVVAMALFGLTAVLSHDTKWPERSFYLAFAPAMGLFVHYLQTGGNLA